MPKDTDTYYTLENDTPRSIANKFGIDVKDFLEWNESTYGKLYHRSKFMANTLVKVRRASSSSSSSSAAAAAAPSSSPSSSSSSPPPPQTSSISSAATPSASSISTTTGSKSREPSSSRGKPPPGASHHARKSSHSNGRNTEETVSPRRSDDSDDNSDEHVYVPDSCVVCGRNDRFDQIVLCDGIRANGKSCDMEYHIFCLQPPLQEVPSGKFIGPCCEKRRQGRKDVARKHSHSSTDSRHKKKRSKKSKKSKKASTPKARSKSQASFPTLQTYLSKTGETFRGIANLFCIDVDVLHQVNEHVSQSSFDKALPILTEIAIPTQATKWTSPDDAAVDTGVKEYLEVSGAADAAAHTTARAATPSRKLSNRAVYYAEDNETLLSISGKFGLDLAALLALNTPLYAGLSPTARLFEDTPIYLKVKPPSAMDAASGDASSSSPTRRTPSATSAASRTHERAWIGTAFLFDTADNDTPGFVANEFGVNHEIVIALNKRRYPGLRRNAQLIENTRLCVPWVPDSKFDLSYCFAHLRPELQVTPLSPIAHVCMFVTGRSDSVRNVAQKLEVDVGEIVALNSNVHAGISKEAVLLPKTALFVPAKKVFWQRVLARWTRQQLADMFSAAK